MAALTFRELTLLRHVLQLARAHDRETNDMHEKVAALHAKFDSFEAAVVAAKTREASLINVNQKQAADLATAQANALSDDTLSAIDALSARLDAMHASLDAPAA